MPKKNSGIHWVSSKKKTSIGDGKFTKHGLPGPHGGNKRYKKAYRGQGK